MGIQEWLKILGCIGIVIGGVVIITVPLALLLSFSDEKISKLAKKIRRIIHGKRKKD